jgi:hypothetical protein
MTKFLTAALLGLSLLASPAAFAGEKTVTLAVQTMYCSACPTTVESSLEAGPGVLRTSPLNPYNANDTDWKIADAYDLSAILQRFSLRFSANEEKK